MEGIDKHSLYRASHMRPERREKWSRVVFMVQTRDNGDEVECKCRLFEHMGMLCCHILKVTNSADLSQKAEQQVELISEKGNRKGLKFLMFTR